MKKIIFIVVLLAAGYSLYNGDFFEFSNKVTVIKLLDTVSSSSVSGREVKLAFNNEMHSICEQNGVDIRNGFGTTEECINRYEKRASAFCFDKLPNLEGKVYTSRLEIKADYKIFILCSMKLSWAN
ncbi:hypothetical protein ACR30L_02065 [Psychromonas sp. PT13]|uniref:hypothetical protein n=1 Tax=Psychromonas sp. PT13 TaxID=3439547 RepID=UPI003EC06A56